MCSMCRGPGKTDKVAPNREPGKCACPPSAGTFATAADDCRRCWGHCRRRRTPPSAGTTHDRCWGHSCTCRLQKMQRLLHRHPLQTAAEDAAATPPPPPALLPSGATSGSRSRSPSREIPTAGWRDPDGGMERSRRWNREIPLDLDEQYRDL